jgi:hypothetical protein
MSEKNKFWYHFEKLAGTINACEETLKYLTALVDEGDYEAALEQATSLATRGAVQVLVDLAALIAAEETSESRLVFAVEEEEVPEQ